METKQFATVSWDVDDVEFVADDKVGYEEAEQFLKDNEQKIIQYLCRVGIDYLEQLWNERQVEEN